MDVLTLELAAEEASRRIGAPTLIAEHAAATGAHAIAGVSGLQAALDSKAGTSHSHAISDVAGLQAALDAKAATSHTHAVADVTGLQAALDGKAASSHTHTIANVTGLQAALDAKAASSHTHAIADTTGLQAALDAKGSLASANSWTAEQTLRENVVVGDSSGTHGEARIRFPTNTSGRGPSVVDFGETTFNSVKDPTLYVGYNQGADGNPIASGEHALSWCIEGYYDDGTADKKMEAYLQYKDGAGANTKRPLFVQFNRTTHFVATTLAGDQVDVGYSDNTTRIARFVRNALTIEAPSTAGDSFLVVKAAVGKAARVQLGYNGVDTVLDWTMLSATQSSILQKDQGGTQQAIVRMYSSKAGAAAKCMTIGGVDETAAALGVYGTRTDQSVLRVRANSTQNNPIIEALDSAGTTTYSGISKGGYPFNRKTSAPADADIATGEMMVWFDSTAGAAKLMVKAKNASGTVVTGSVALT